jgi:hypothetical protein
LKAALRKTSKGASSKARSVSWAEDVREKAPLKLTELLAMPVFDVSSISSRVWQLSQDPQGTFEVQKALDACASEEARWALAAELRGNVWEAAQCPHANHVLRKVITSMASPALNFIISELLSKGSSAVTDLARHRYGCRIIEGLLIHCTQEQMSVAVECLFTDACALCIHMYGNFVMQRLLEHSSAAHRELLMNVVQGNVVPIGSNFYGSAVLGKALEFGSTVERRLLTRAVLSVEGLLSAVARHKHGKAAADLVVSIAEGAEKTRAVAQLASPPLKMPKLGRGHPKY